MVTVTAVANDTPGLGPKKTFLVMVTVVGCIAILWPKVFYPMMFSAPTKPIKDYRNGPGCCEVVLDQHEFANVSSLLIESSFRKKMNLITGEYSIRQERPPHLRPDGIHPAMKERGRAIPNAPTVPIITEKSRKPTASAPRIVEGRPGPIPGMRPPMGAGSVHQATQKGNSMGLIMPLYTIGIVAFFIYTIMKLVFKKTEANSPYDEPSKPNPDFTNQVFGQDKRGGTITNIGWHNMPNGIHHNNQINPASVPQMANNELEYKLRETEQLLEISILKKKLFETEKAMSKIIAEMSTIPRVQNATEHNGDVPLMQNGHILINDQNSSKENNLKQNLSNEIIETLHLNNEPTMLLKSEQRKRDRSNDRSVKVLGMEMTTSCMGGQKWNAPLESTEKRPHKQLEPEPHSIFLERSLPHESQILVSDSETTAEEIFDNEMNGTVDEPAVVLSSKMTLSLINLDPIQKSGTHLNGSQSDNDAEKCVSEEEYSEEEIDEIVEEEADNEEYEVSDEEVKLVNANKKENN